VALKVDGAAKSRIASGWLLTGSRDYTLHEITSFRSAPAINEKLGGNPAQNFRKLLRDA
jgi:hypothetical protein